MYQASRQIQLGSVAIGGGAPISMQSMCNTDTGDADATLAQIARVRALGCQIIRVALPAMTALPAFTRIVAESPLPVVADIHFDYRLALAAITAGAPAIRVNPGNLRGRAHIDAVARAAAAAGTVVRIGVNSGSLEPDMEKRHGRSPEAMVQSALAYAGLFSAAGCTRLKVSLKASDVRLTLAANRRFAELSDLPLHLGVTEAGTPSAGVVKSAIGIGALLADGIGDTIRVSLTAPPEEEIIAARRILAALGLDHSQPELVSCPTCGRTAIDLLPLVQAVEAELARLAAAGKHIRLRKIAVMGCEVNGPGEARDADLGVAGGKAKGILFKFGQPVRTMPEAELLPALLAEIRAATE